MTARPDLVDAALDLVRHRAGLTFTGPRRPAFESALLGCMRRSGAGDLESYLRMLPASPALFDDLAAEITVGETYFLRDPGQWHLLRSRLLPDLLARHGRPLRIWSAGCASGEEAYSAALVLHQLGAAGRAQIVGTDISRPALARARRAEYSDWALRNVPEDVVRLYFRRSGRRYDLVPWVRGQVGFRYLNLAEDAPGASDAGMGQMDLILCRNVLIYFDEKTVVRVVKRLLESLSEGGSLMLGASDPLLVGLLPCAAEVTEAGLLYRQSADRTRLVTPEPRRCQPAEPARLPDVPAALPPVAAAVPPVTVTCRDGDVRVEARRRYEAKDYAAAAELAEAMIRGGARDAEVEILLVRSLANRGDLVRAELACAAALDVHRDCAELAFLHAVLLTRAGRHAEAIGALRRALYLDRRLVVAHLALGDALARSGDTAGAARAFRAAARLLAGMPTHEPVPASDGEPAARLAAAARSQLRLLDQPVA